MRILFLTQVLPYPLTSGANTRAYYVLRHLSQRHDITLASFVRADDDEEAIAHLGSFCRVVHVVPMKRSRLKDLAAGVQGVVSGRPAIIIRDRLATMEGLLSQLVGEQPFDVVHADQTSMAQYALYAHSAAPSDAAPATILDQHNALYKLVERQSSYEAWPWRTLWRREARALAAYERKLLSSFDQVLTVTEQDKRALLALSPETQRVALAEKISPIPICIDPGSQVILRRSAKGAQIVHLGTMFWPPNIHGVLWFASQVLPLIWREIPEARFIVAGRRPPAEVLALADHGTDQGGEIVVTGFVPDPRPMLEQSQVFVVPVRAGGGMRVKIVDAWLWGMPVVSTTIGAEGLNARDGENILLADDPEEFARAVIRVLRNPDVAASMRVAGRAWVERHFDYRQRYDQLDSVYERATNSRTKYEPVARR